MEFKGIRQFERQNVVILFLPQSLSVFSDQPVLGSKLLDNY